MTSDLIHSIREVALEYGLALTTVAVTAVVVTALAAYVTTTDQAMIYLLGVLVVACRVRLGPAGLAALASVTAFDSLSVEVHARPYLATCVVMVVVATVVSSLATKLRAQARDAKREQGAASAGIKKV